MWFKKKKKIKTDVDMGKHYDEIMEKLEKLESQYIHFNIYDYRSGRLKISEGSIKNNKMR